MIIVIAAESLPCVADEMDNVSSCDVTMGRSTSPGELYVTSDDVVCDAVDDPVAADLEPAATTLPATVAAAAATTRAMQSKKSCELDQNGVSKQLILSPNGVYGNAFTDPNEGDSSCSPEINGVLSSSTPLTGNVNNFARLNGNKSDSRIPNPLEQEIAALEIETKQVPTNVIRTEDNMPLDEANFYVNEIETNKNNWEIFDESSCADTNMLNNVVAMV